MRAMLLCAGRSTRLWPLTVDRPKAAVPLGPLTLAEHGLSWLARHGVEEAIVNLHHQGEALARRLGTQACGVRLRYSRETQLLGTGGALDLVRDQLAAGGETFVVANGKLVTEIDLGRALAAHRRSGALVTLVLRPNPAPERISTVLTDPERRWVRGFVRPRPPPVEEEPALAGRVTVPQLDEDAGAGGLMYTGIALWEPALLERVPRGRASDVVTSVWEPLIAERAGRGEPAVGCVVDDALWLEPSTLRDYLDAWLALQRRDPQLALVHPAAHVPGSARLERTVVLEGAVIGAGAELVETVVGERVVVPPGLSAYRQVLVQASDVEAPAPAGQTCWREGTLVRVALD